MTSFGHPSGRRFASLVGERGRARAALAALAIAALILLACVPQARTGASPQAPHPAGALSLAPRGTAAAAAAARPASMGVSTEPHPAAAQAAPAPAYDEQLGTTFTQDFNALAYNVTALAQADADGYGPGYLLNGLSTQGYWYQVGLSYHWPNSDGSYYKGFGFSYQVYGTDGKPLYPSAGAGLGTFSGVVNSGDSVLLSLNFTGPTVTMLVKDWNTGAAAATSYSSEGALAFVGDAFASVNAHGFFTGLMTEWYHAAPYYGNEGEVTYTNKAVHLNSAWMWIDEFESGSTAPSLFYNQTQSPVTFANDEQVYPFAASGATMFMSAHQLVTGLSAGSSSKLTLSPAAAGSSSPGFSASYTFAGEPRTAVIATGDTLLTADPGTSIKVSINSSASSALERWVFNGTAGNEVVFAAGTNATFVFYHLVQEAVSYRVAGGGQPLPASSKAELTYEQPPPGPSGTSAPVTATQVLGTSPVVIYAVVGTVASVGTIPGAAGERWAAGPQNWTISAPNETRGLIPLYQQYDVSISYSVVGGGTLPGVPSFNSTAFGVPAVIQLSSSRTTGWFDAGSGFSFTGALNGSTPTERWSYLGGGPGLPGAGEPRVVAPNQEISGDYIHQYRVDLAVNDVNAGAISGTYTRTIGAGSPVEGSVSTGPTWVDAGQVLNLTATAEGGWQFETWQGSGAGAQSGAGSSIEVTVTGPLSERAIFYPQLTISADGGTNIAFSYGSQAGTVQAGTTRSLYVPPSSNVTLRASPSLFVYSFASWQGAGLAKPAEPSVSLVVGSPTKVTGASSLDYPVISALAAAAALIVLAASLVVRNVRRREGARALPSQ